MCTCSPPAGRTSTLSCAVRIEGCVSASTVGHSHEDLLDTRLGRPRHLVERVHDDEGRPRPQPLAPRRSCPWMTSLSPGTPACSSSPNVDTSAARPSLASSRRTAAYARPWRRKRPRLPAPRSGTPSRRSSSVLRSQTTSRVPNSAASAEAPTPPTASSPSAMDSVSGKRSSTRPILPLTMVGSAPCHWPFRPGMPWASPSSQARSSCSRCCRRS